jgi:hypothetical protein
MQRSVRGFSAAKSFASKVRSLSKGWRGYNKADGPWNLRRPKMQNEPKSAELAEIHWLAEHFLSCGFNFEAETAYLTSRFTKRL